MISVNFSKRILTSVVLLLILFGGLFLNNFLFFYLLMIASMISFYEFNILIKKKYKNKKIEIYSSNAFSFLFLIFFIFASYDLYVSSLENFLFILLICIFSDTGGYLFGKLIGGKKLTKISPKKTISGSIGSFIFSFIPILILDNKSLYTDITLLIFMCFFLSLVCQLGDLFFSYFKRQAKVKDTGTLLPGHGGLLDRIDGVIFVLPVAYFLNKIFL
tara:strand:- start:209 stop:859 length:651 start_codon:yes stop_codon:yes gene_type:complete